MPEESILACLVERSWVGFFGPARKMLSSIAAAIWRATSTPKNKHPHSPPPPPSPFSPIISSLSKVYIRQSMTTTCTSPSMDIPSWGLDLAPPWSGLGRCLEWLLLPCHVAITLGQGWSWPGPLVMDPVIWHWFPGSPSWVKASCLVLVIETTSGLTFC